MSDLNRARVVNDTSNIALIQAFDTTTGKPKTGLLHSTSDLVIYAAKNTAAPASIGTLVTMTEGTWTTLGFKECANTPGTYQIGVPNTWYDTAGALFLTGRVTSDDTVYFRPESISIANSDVYAAPFDFSATLAEATAVPSATASFIDKFKWMFALARNKITQTATTQLVRNDADSATIGTATVSDDGTTAIRGEFS